MAHRASEPEERVMAGEVTLTAQDAGTSEFPMVQVRVTYLGRNPHKTQRLKGQILVQQFIDPDDENPDESKRKRIEIRQMVTEGYTTYNFETKDGSGRAIRRPKLPAGQELVWHLAHIKWFAQQRDVENQPEYRISGSEAAMAVVKRYIEFTKKPGNPDRGEPVLKEMEDKF